MRAHRNNAYSVHKAMKSRSSARPGRLPGIVDIITLPVRRRVVKVKKEARILPVIILRIGASAEGELVDTITAG